MDELKEYYESEIYEQGMPKFEDTEPWQRSQMENSLAFNRWRLRKAIEKLVNTLSVCLKPSNQ